MAAIKSLKDGKVGSRDVDEGVLAGVMRPAVLRHAVVMYEGNLRVGTVQTKTRHFVSGSTKKMYKQKHTGRARHGDKKAPSFRGGGVAHGPHPRDYRVAIPKKALRQALRVALAGKLRDGQIAAWAGKPVSKVSTKAVAGALESLGAPHSALIVAPGAVDRSLLLSVRNLHGVKALPAAEVTAHDVVAHRLTVLLDGAYEALQKRLVADGERSETAGEESAS
jgi:large subunit ribosomal protein L4